jgi:hypothetical protein
MMHWWNRVLYKFTKGQVVHLDDVYDILGVIPGDTYEQDDPANPHGDRGESLRFVKNIEIKIHIRVS